MKHEIDQIKQLCQTYKTEPKLLLIPTTGMKIQVLKTLNDNGVNAMNLAAMSMREFVSGITGTAIANEGLTVIDNKDVIDVMTDLVRKLQETDDLKFLGEIEITHGICKAITKTVLELLENGYPDCVSLDKVENDNKREDLKLIIKKYIEWKKENSRVDYADKLNRALDVLKESGFKSGYASVYALQACEFNNTEEAISDKLGTQKAAAETQAKRTTRYDVELQAKNVSLFKAYGDHNEVKEVLRLIIQDKLPFDSVLIAAPKVEPYSQLLYQLLQQYTCENESLPGIKELPITFGHGLPLLLSSPARLFALLLDWVGGDYRSRGLINILSSGVFDVSVNQNDDDIVGRAAIIKQLKKSNLTWQRDSYITCLQSHLERLEDSNNRDAIYEKAEDSESSKDSGSAERAKKAVKWLLEFVKDAFGKIPEVGKDGLINPAELLDGIKSITKTYLKESWKYSPLDREGFNVIMHELDTSLKDRYVKPYEAVEIIKEYMKDISIMTESPSPGKMHFATYKKASWIERDNVFLVGLGADNFPGMGLEDPLLLDGERQSQSLLTSKERINRNIESMNVFIENIKENLTCSYSYYDTVDIRDSFPSTLFRKMEENYPNTEVRRVDFVLNEDDFFLDANDYWTHHGVKEDVLVSSEAPAKDPASAPVWGSGETSIPQPIRLELSATTLKAYLDCKYKFYLKAILKLKEVEDDEVDVLGWLSSLESGNVYHEIFESFTKAAKESPDILRDKEAAIEAIKTIAFDKIRLLSNELPKASDFHTESQQKEIFDNVAKFAEAAVDEKGEREPLSAEYAFGVNAGQAPVEIELGEGVTIAASGKIDRIDRLGDGSVEIIDYKTGKSRYYKDLSSPADVGLSEANAQLALYYLALRKLARDGDKQFENIKSMAYRFVTAKGDYETISLQVEDDAEETYKAAFLNLYRDYEKGVFLPEKGAATEDGEEEDKVNCNFCGYSNSCKHAFVDNDDE